MRTRKSYMYIKCKKVKDIISLTFLYSVCTRVKIWMLYGAILRLTTLQHRMSNNSMVCLFHYSAVCIVELSVCEVNTSVYGCTIRHIYRGSFAYSDDISRASSTICGLKNVCHLPKIQDFLILRKSRGVWHRYNHARYQLVNFNSNASSSLILKGTQAYWKYHNWNPPESWDTCRYKLSRPFC